MSSFFAFLFLIALGFLIWGLIAPKKLSKFSRKPLTRRDVGVGFGVITLVFAVLSGATAPTASITNKPDTESSKSTISQRTPKSQAKLPVVKDETETQTIPFNSTIVNDPTMTKGATKVTTIGVNGTKTLTYKVTFKDGKQTDKQLIKEEVTTPPVDQVTTVGTYVKSAPAPASSQSSNCDPNYSGACVPNIYPADVDCGGGSGNGPYYVYGTVHVIGVDHYNLDGDGDGYGCE